MKVLSSWYAPGGDYIEERCNGKKHEIVRDSGEHEADDIQPCDCTERRHQDYCDMMDALSEQEIFITE